MNGTPNVYTLLYSMVLKITHLLSPKHLFCIGLVALPLVLGAQNKETKAVNKAELNHLVESIADSMETYYVDLEIGKKVGSLIQQKNKAGAYKKLSDPAELAKQLTSDLRSVNGDKHLYMTYRPVDTPSESKKSAPKVDKSGKWSNYGFQELKILEENIGYLKIKHFSNWDHFEEAKKVTAVSVGFLKNSDAIVIDVRDNGGGFEYIVAYLISYFFDGDAIHLSDYYYRYNDTRYGVHTVVDVPGKKLPDVPIYVLVNSATASAGESLAYMLKHLGRATIVGEVTMGAGNGAMYHRLNDRFLVSIASETTINTITKTSFEQVGVIPNIKTKSEEAFDEAYKLAKMAAVEYRLVCEERNSALLSGLENALKDYNPDTSDSLILSSLKGCQKEELLDESKINRMGYDYLMKHKKPNIAGAIFRANTLLFPNSANVYDSYAESLYLSKNLEEALTNYQKAADIAKANDNPNLDLFLKNLEKVKGEILDKR